MAKVKVLDLGKAIREACVEAGILNGDNTPSKTKLADVSGVDPRLISQMFKGNKKIKLEKVEQAFNACGKSLGDYYL